MRRLPIVVLALLLATPLAAAPQLLQPPGAAPQPPSEPPVPQEPVPPPRDFDVFGRSTRSALRIGQDLRLAAGDAVRDAVVIFGDATIAGDVDGNLVVVLGNLELARTAVIRGNVVSVGGRVAAQPGVEARGDFVVVGGIFDPPATFAPRGEYVVVGGELLGEWLQGIAPYLTRGLLWGRLIVPDLPWVWPTVGLFFLMYLVLNALFGTAVRACATTLAARPLTSFGVGLLVMLLVGPVCLLLVVSVAGIPVVPFVLLALLGGWIIGKVGVARWLGMSLGGEDADSRVQALRSVVIGFVVITIAYMIPVLGLATWAIIGVLGLGSSTLAFLSGYRRENPKAAPTRASRSWRGWGAAHRREDPERAAAAPDVPPLPVPATYSPPEPPPTPAASAPAPSASFAATQSPPAMAYEAMAGAGAAAAAAAFPLSAPSSLLAAMPKALFRDRLAAFVVDIALIATAVNLLGADPDEMFLPIVLAYYIGMWTWKQTTIGGMVCQLRIVRTDGSAPTLADNLVRGLTAIVSLAVFAVGALWMLRDRESQTWHDKIAGTYVVKVPRGWT